MYDFLKNIFASEQPVMERFNIVDPTAVGNNVRSISLAYTPATEESPTSAVSLYWTESNNKVYEKQFKDEAQAQNLFGSMKKDLQEVADLTRTEKMESAASLVRSLLKRYAIYTDEIVDGNPAPVTETNAGLKLSKVQNPLVNKHAKVVMQNLFFETPEELQKYQDMNKKNNPGSGKQLGDFKDDLPPLDKEKGMGNEMPGEDEGADGLAPSSLSYEDYEKEKGKEQKSLSKRIEREVKDQVQSALERKIASTFDDTDDELIDAMRQKGRTWDEIKNYYIKNLQYDKESVAAFIDALREAETGQQPGMEPKLDAPMGEEPVEEEPSAPKPPTDLVSPETHDKLVKEIDDKTKAPEVPEEHEIEKHDMQLGEIAAQSMEISKVAEEPLETIPKSRPEMGKDFDFLPDETEMSEDMSEDPAASADPQDSATISNDVELIPGPDTKVYVMKDYQSGDGGYEGTLVSKFKQAGDDWGVVDSQGEMKEVPMRDIKRASDFRKLVKKIADKKKIRDAEKAKKAQAELRAIMAEIHQVDVALKIEATSSVVMPMEYAITDKDILAYAEGSIYASKIKAGEMTDEDWQLLVKETGRWMPHVDRQKTSMFYPQDANWNFDSEQIAKIKNMFQNLPATSSLKVASGCSVKDCTNPVEETLNGKPYCKKHLWGIDPKKKEAAAANVPCAKCGRKDMPLHTDMMCHNCSPKGEEKQADVEVDAAGNNDVINAFVNGFAEDMKTKSSNLYMRPIISGVELINYQTVIAVRVDDKISVSTLQYSSTTAKLQRAIIDAANAAGKTVVSMETGKPIDPKAKREPANFNKLDMGQPYERLSSLETVAAPGDKKPAVAPAAPSTDPKVKGPELDEPWKKAPEGLRDETPVLAPQEVQALYNQVKDTEIKIQKIKIATDEIMKNAQEDVRKFKEQGGAQGLAEQMQAGVQKLYAALSTLNAKVVEVDTTLLAFVKETNREDVKWTAAEKLKRVIEKFPQVEKYLDDALNGAQSQAQMVEKQQIIPFPKAQSKQLSRFDKRADLMDTLTFILDNIDAAIAALSGTDGAPQPA